MASQNEARRRLNLHIFTSLTPATSRGDFLSLVKVGRSSQRHHSTGGLRDDWPFSCVMVQVRGAELAGDGDDGHGPPPFPPRMQKLALRTSVVKQPDG